MSIYLRNFLKKNFLSFFTRTHGQMSPSVGTDSNYGNNHLGFRFVGMSPEARKRFLDIWRSVG